MYRGPTNPACGYFIQVEDAKNQVWNEDDKVGDKSSDHAVKTAWCTCNHVLREVYVVYWSMKWDDEYNVLKKTGDWLWIMYLQLCFLDSNISQLFILDSQQPHIINIVHLLKVPPFSPRTTLLILEFQLKSNSNLIDLWSQKLVDNAKIPNL